jgi:tetratricopeptide (TPR) repeat protein
MRRAETLAGNELADPNLVGRTRTLLAALEQVEADRRMVARVEYIRLNERSLKGGLVRSSNAGQDSPYHAAFQEYGLPILDLEVEEAARRIASSSIRDWLIAALDDWANNSADWCGRLLPVALRADDNPWRRQYIEARIRNDLPALLRLAKQPETLSQPPGILAMLCLRVFLIDQDAAVELLREAQRRHPGDVWINLNLATQVSGLIPSAKTAEQVMSVQGEIIEFQRAALAAYPESPALRTELGLSLARANRLDDAAGVLQQAIDLNPNNGYAYTILGETLVRQGITKQDREKTLSGLPYLSRAIELEPKLVWPLIARARAYNTLGQREKAVEDYSRAIKIEPKNALLRKRRADALSGLMRWDEAIAEYTNALSMGDASAVYGRGNAFAGVGQWEKAAADYSNFLRLMPGDVDALGRRGLAYRNLGLWVEAVDDYHRALELRSDWWQCQMDLAWILATCPELSVRNPAQAVELARHLVKQVPTDCTCWTTLGAAQYRTQDWQGAIESLTKATSFPQGQEALAFFFLAMSHQKLGHKEEARRFYDRAMQWLARNKQALARDPPAAEQLARIRSEAEEVLELKKK